MCETSKKLFSWLVENIEKGTLDDYVNLNQIKTKYQGPVTSVAVGNSITSIFPEVKVKQRRCQENWSKKTQCYYGIKWIKATDVTENSSCQFSDVLSNLDLPEDFFLISKTATYLKLGHFSGEIINGQKVLCEIKLNSDQTWNFFIMGRVIYPENVSIDDKYSTHSVFEIVRQFRYCEGIGGVDLSDTAKEQSYFQECVTRSGNENFEIIRYRSKNCKKLLPFKNSKSVSKTCGQCKKLERHTVNLTETNIENDDNSSGETILTLNEDDNNDLATIFQNVFPQCTEKMKCFLMSQKTAMERHPNGRRWDRDIIRLCLTLWCRSPRGYRELRNSNFLVLPSEKSLQIFKNNVNQKAGINNDMLHWMVNEARLKNISPEGYKGGLIIDEMSIQPDLQFKKKDGQIELIGFTELTPESLVFEKMKSQKNERILATHVLQFVFLGFTGFRFPFAHFPSSTASGHDLYLLLWKAVNMLLNFGFIIQYVSTDGAQTNRDLFKLLIPGFKSAEPKTCAFNNIYSPGTKICFIMDISHVIKKIRNNLSKSGDASHCTRHIQYDNTYIEWNHFRNAYLWDISSHPFPLHHRLTRDHFFLTSEAKMRNHLAEDVLNGEMLHLMEMYKNSLSDDGHKLNGTIELLKNTSVLITNFRDSRPLLTADDDRIKQNHDVMDFFVKWEKNVISDEKIKSKEKSLISHQTRQDIISSILGFEELCFYKLKNSNSSIIPNRVNSDIIENVFCQQRTLHNGANTNPTYLGYCHSTNSVILGQASVSRKSNAGSIQVPKVNS